MPSLALIAPLIGGALSAGSSLLAPALGIGLGAAAPLAAGASDFGGLLSLGDLASTAGVLGAGGAGIGAAIGDVGGALGSGLSDALSLGNLASLSNVVPGAVSSPFAGAGSSLADALSLGNLASTANVVPGAISSPLAGGSNLADTLSLGNLASTANVVPGAITSPLAGAGSTLGDTLSLGNLASTTNVVPGSISSPFSGLTGGAALGGIPSSVSGALSSIPTGSGLDLGAPGGAPVQSNPVSTGGGGSTTGTMTSAPTDPSAPVNTPPPTTGGPNSSPGILGQVGDFLQKNKGLLQLLTEGGALGASMLMKPSIPSISSSLNSLNPQSAIGQEATAGTTGANIAASQQAAAKNVSAAAQPLLTAPVTGQLPPGMQTLITQALQDTQTGIRSMYASRGMSGSSAEEQDLAAAQERAAAATANLLLTTGQTGASYAGLANQTLSSALTAAQLQGTIYSQIAGVQLSEDTQLQETLSQLAAASAAGAGFNAQTAAAAA